MKINQKNTAIFFGIFFVLAGTVMLYTIPSAFAGVPPPPTGTFTEWDAIALSQPVRDHNPHITELDETGATGFPIDMPFYTIDNRVIGPPCALGHLNSATDTLCSWGFGFGFPVGLAIDPVVGRAWVTVTGSMEPDGSPVVSPGNSHVAFMHAGAGQTGIAANADPWTHFPNTGGGLGLELDFSGNAYYAETLGTFGCAGFASEPDKITRVTPAGSYKRWCLPNTGGLQAVEPRYPEFDNTGENVYFTTAASRNLCRINTTTNLLTCWAYPVAAGASFNALDAFGIFIQNDNAIWYTDHTGDNVGRLDPATNTYTNCIKAGTLNGPQFIVISSNNQAFISNEDSDDIAILDIDAIPADADCNDTVVAPSSTELTTEESSATPITFNRDRICRVQPPTVTPVEGTDPSSINFFPLPMANANPIGITDVVETTVGSTQTTGIYGDEFGNFNVLSKIYLFESSIIIPPTPIFIGGEIIPTDTTALLLVGTQMTAAWLIPVIVAAIGIGIVIARKL